MSKLLTVFGATGQQGKALIDYVLASPSLSPLFTLRAVTRDPTKPAAVALKERGVEVVKADLDVRSTVFEAVSGSYAVFAVTQFWERASAEVEIAQGKAMADAAVAAGVTQLIWSSLPSVTEMTHDKITVVEHFDSKAEVEAYIRTLEIKSMFYMPGWFMQNFLLPGMQPQKMDDGSYVLPVPWSPETPTPLVDIRDTGKFLAPALRRPDEYQGKRFTCATAFTTPAVIAEIWSNATGKKVVHQVPESAQHANVVNLPGLKEAGDLLYQYGYYGSTGEADLAWTLEQLDEKPTSWEQFLRDNEPWFT
ncbi:hypothetical protein S7711_06220 [Stachybotrys chartarum IBT 7711]|uniref:NmrA-like domain-containing protein n=1 Tax=Stachybotrys chartarum (strain CBS 109288 / IBT 7711) TaxID=1280523 RepID=A0A084AWB2_STACB|nr:hypothetical protein S7711_06220 [Stachybotrys chartarum IBT 7711]